MNAEELRKYLLAAIVPLYPDLEDTPGKRVALKLDSGPGRTNIVMLSELCIKGYTIMFTRVYQTQHMSPKKQIKTMARSRPFTETTSRPLCITDFKKRRQ